MQATKSKTVKKVHADNALEAVRDMGKEVLTELGTESINTMWEQLLGSYAPENSSTSGDLSEGQEIDLSKKPQKEAAPYIEAGIDYRQEIMYGERRISRETEQQLNQQVQEILAELQRLVNSSQALESQFKDVAVVQVPAGKPGKYHVNFFSWVLHMVKLARTQVEDSAAWLSLFKSKKGEKQYWAMFKKHGTSFGMSNERSVATQVG